MNRADLPVSWDGVPIEWSPWSGPLVNLCAKGWRAKDRTASCCGTLVQPTTSIGVEVDPPTPAGIVRRRYRLMAFRCSCGHDEVHDIATDEWWDLDETDYGPGGSEVTQKVLF
jgi:hypothetical protein